MGVTGLFGASALLAIGLAGFSRRRKIVSALAVIGIVMLVAACNKNELAAHGNDQKIWVRIAQVDKDGATQYSKVVQAVKE